MNCRLDKSIKCPELVNSTVVTYEDILILRKYILKHQGGYILTTLNDSEKINFVCVEKEMEGERMMKQSWQKDVKNGWKLSKWYKD